MIVYECQQGSEAWIKLRLGKPTASEFSKIITPSKGDYSKSASKYIAQLIQETRIPWLPERAECYANRSMKWGKEMEAEARRWYALESGFDVRQVGFITDDSGRFGCSPDALIYENDVPVGGLELKCTDPDSNVHTEWLLAGGLPLDHKCQVHGGLAVSNLKWWEFVSYPPPPNDDGERLPPLRVRVMPDEFTDSTRVAMERFWMDYTEALARIKAM